MQKGLGKQPQGYSGFEDTAGDEREDEQRDTFESLTSIVDTLAVSERE